MVPTTTITKLPSHPHITANPKPPTLTFPKMQHAQASASPEPMQLPSLSLCRPHNPDFKHMPTHTRSFDNLTDPTCPETKLFQINPPPTCRTASPIQATPTRDPGPCANHTPTTPANHTASTPSQCHDSKHPSKPPNITCRTAGPERLRPNPHVHRQTRTHRQFHIMTCTPRSPPHQSTHTNTRAHTHTHTPTAHTSKLVVLESQNSISPPRPPHHSPCRRRKQRRRKRGKRFAPSRARTSFCPSASSRPAARPDYLQVKSSPGRARSRLAQDVCADVLRELAPRPAWRALHL